MKNFINWLMGTTETSQHVSKDLVIATCDGKLITQSMLNELKYRHLMGVWCREQMERHAAACQEVLGIDPHDERLCDLANEIVTTGCDPMQVIQRINSFCEVEQ